MQKKNFTNHIHGVIGELRKLNLDALLVSSEPNMFYLTGYPCRESFLLISKHRHFYITDSRYAAEAQQALDKIAAIRKADGAIFRCIAGICNERGLRKLGFEEQAFSFAQYKSLNRALKSSSARLVPTREIIEQFRKIKSSGEVETIRKAAQISIKAMRFAKRILKPGRKETEIAAQLERFVRLNGARSSAFDIIVASGHHSAHPHHLTSQRKLRDNEAVLIDMGVDYQGYKSDLTRVFFLGKISPLAKRIYSIVLSAQQKAIKAIRPGVEIKYIDHLARNVIAGKGLQDRFNHSLGHGIGIQVHEAPRISRESQGILKEGMIFTVEPGIYLPGKLGIRLEDMILVTDKDCEVISGALHK